MWTPKYILKNKILMVYSFKIGGAGGRLGHLPKNLLNLQKAIEYTMYIIEMSYTLYYSCIE